jgi:hypothetical protein
MPIHLTNFNDLQDKYYGKPGTPEREAYEAGFRRELNKEKLARLVKKVKANARRLSK